MTATLQANHTLSLSEDVLAQGCFKVGMKFHVTLQPSGAMILRPILKGFGCLKGKISMPADFDEPLEDFKDYMA